MHGKLRTLAAGVCLGMFIWSTTAPAQETQKAPEVPDAQEASPLDEAPDASILWFDLPEEFQEADPERVREHLRTLAKQFAGDVEVLAVYVNLHGVAIQMRPAAAQQRLRELEATEVEAERNLGAQIDFIEEDGDVTLFEASGCGETPGAFPALAQDPPQWWLTRVQGPIQKQNTNFASTVWLIDSGVAPEYDKVAGNPNAELNIDCARAAYCPKGQGQDCSVEEAAACTATLADRRPETSDEIGHGTMIAGMIGAIDNSVGYVGVAPDVRIVPIKVFDKKPTIRWSRLYKAVDYLLQQQPEAGDVVNISWGGRWDPGSSGQQMLENTLRQLADTGVRVSIAAGNNDVMNGSGYVQTISPARAGGYRSADPLGVVLTASAVNETDEFWGELDGSEFVPFSGYGNRICTSGMTPECSGAPDFAEPGVAVKSLWHGLQSNICTGTSFSAAILSGLLVQRVPHAEFKSEGSAFDDPTGLDPMNEDALDDPIGICDNGGGATCVER